MLIPFTTSDPGRKKVFAWVLAYWKSALPEAEFIIGESDAVPFSKTEALNRAAAKAVGDVLVILDADAYMDPEVIRNCAARIMADSRDHLWFVPYRRLYRLREDATARILATDPAAPLRLPWSDLPEPIFIEGDGTHSRYGHRYGAMVMIFPREALTVVGGFDERFKGWGGEDVAFLQALDTLHGKHKTIDTNLYHLWHPYNGELFRIRRWDGQKEDNNRLNMRYRRANRNPEAMRRLLEEPRGG